MKFFIQFLCLTVLVVEISSDASCEQWPAELKSLKKCCEIPFHEGSSAEENCIDKCFAFENNMVKLEICMEDCFNSTIPAYAKNQKIDENDKNFLMSYYSQAWKRILPDAYKKCEMNSTGKLNSDYRSYVNCLRDYFTQNCIRFKTAEPGCDLVEEHFKTCKKIEPNCAAPFPLDYENCCKVPKLISNETIEKCEDQCNESNYFRIMVRKCFFDCIVNDTKFIKNNALDYEVLKNLLLANQTAEWEKPIAAVAKKCESEVKG